MKLTLRRIAEANRRAKSIEFSTISLAKQVVEDPSKEDRLAACRCRTCYYLRRNSIVGQAFTKWQCLGCEVWSMAPNTNTPELCLPCAKKYGLCTQCVADLNLEERTSFQKSAAAE